jgi:putative tricarboxylic transport membrane protein
VAGLAVLSRLSGGSILMSLLMVGFGLAIGTVGMEPISGVRRFTFGSIPLSQGIELVPVIMGLYGVAEVLVLAEEGMRRAAVTRVQLRDLFPTREEWRRSSWPIARGSVVGFLTGLIPGPATVLAAFISYALERRISKTPERFGHGAIEGVAGPETANNGATAGAMVPLLSLGIPFSPATAILLGALVIHGIQPGPLLMAQKPEVFWGVVASMYVGNFLLLILNLPLVGLFVSVLRMPQHLLSTVVLLLCLVGAYSLNNSPLDLWVLVGFGILGYLFRKLTVDPAPLIIAVVLGPLMEKTLRQTLFMAHGDWRLLLLRPLSLTLLALGAAVLILPPLVAALRRRSAQPAVATGGS